MLGEWNEDELRAHFRQRTAQLEAWLSELKARGCTLEADRIRHDEILADLVVYRVLLDSTALSSRMKTFRLLATLGYDPPVSPEALEPEGFKEVVWRRANVLIGEIRDVGDASDGA